MADRVVGVMQPYIFPYVGYFQLINSVNHFVFYDDVNFIKRGWINRNNILWNGSKKLLSLPCIKASQNSLINEIQFDTENRAYKNFSATITQGYKKAPYFKEVIDLIEGVLYSGESNVAVATAMSIQYVIEYLGLSKSFYFSSERFSDSKGLDRAERLQQITKELGSKNYVNSIGGLELYSKADFQNSGVELKFLSPEFGVYEQFGHAFVPGLSIIDLLMFCSPEEVKTLIGLGELV